MQVCMAAGFWASDAVTAADQSLIAQLPWDSGSTEYVVSVYEAHEGLPSRVITFKAAEEGRQLVSFKTADSFVSAFTLRDVGGCLISLWTTGSAYHVWGFFSKGGAVHDVIDVWSKSPPNLLASVAPCPTLEVLKNDQWSRFSWQTDSYIEKSIGSEPPRGQGRKERP